MHLAHTFFFPLSLMGFSIGIHGIGHIYSTVTTRLAVEGNTGVDGSVYITRELGYIYIYIYGTKSRTGIGFF